MPPLHAPTLMLSLIAILLTTGVLLLISSRQNRKEPGLVFWGCGNLAGALGLMLLASRGSAPDRLSIDLANAALFLAYMLHWAGMRRYCHKPVSWPLLLVPSLGWLALCQLSPVFYASVEWRLAVNSLTSGAISFATAWTLWSYREEPLVSRPPLVAWLVIHGIIFFVRIPFVMVADIKSATAMMLSPVLTLVLAESLIHTSIASFLLLSLAKDRAENCFRRAAETDMLTGMPNRRAFFDNAAPLLERTVAAGGKASVLILDVDRFKAINDTFGHSAGDAALVCVARAIAGHLRPTDVFGRLGGEEFGCFLPDTSLQSAAVLAEGLRARIAALEIETEGPPMRLSVSIGLSSTETGPQGLDQLLAEADAGLYQAKRNGRDRVVAMDVGFREAS